MARPAVAPPSEGDEVPTVPPLVDMAEKPYEPHYSRLIRPGVSGRRVIRKADGMS